MTQPDRLIRDLLERAVLAHRALADRAEEVEDEWSYVNDLHEAWSTRLADLVDRRGDEPVDPAVSIALDEAIAEIETVTDPHRAIDWLSTFPQIVLVAVGEPA
jgi:hypothetical protein